MSNFKASKAVFGALLGLFIAEAAGASTARAAYIVNVREIDGGVAATASGSLDFHDLSFVSFATPFNAGIDSTLAYLGLGNLDGHGDAVNYGDQYKMISGPTSFGSGFLDAPNSTTGNIVAIYGADGILTGPPDYVGGTALVGAATWFDTTFAELGLLPGVYVWKWGSGETADSYTLNIIASTEPSPVPEPSTWAMLTFGFSGLGLAACWRARKPIG